MPTRATPGSPAHPDPIPHAALPPPPTLRWAALDATGALDAVVTTRHGGVSTGRFASLNLGLHVGDDPGAVTENRRLAVATVGASLDQLVVADQVHGAHTAVVDAADAGRGARRLDDAIPHTDALVTASPEVTLAILVADCVPLVLIDPDAAVLGCVHAGWRGTAAGVATAALATMAALGADAGRVVAGVGPAVDPAVYVVGNEVATALRGSLGRAADDVLTPLGADQWRCDLVAANTVALVAAGVEPGNIHPMTTTTANPDLFSHRRGDGGRFAAIARLTRTTQP